MAEPETRARTRETFEGKELPTQGSSDGSAEAPRTASDVEPGEVRGDIVPPDSRLRLAARRVAKALGKASPHVRRWLLWTAALTVLFVGYVLVLGGLTHTSEQRRLRDEFGTLVASGWADRPTWKPVPGQPTAILSIPRIGMNEVVVQDSTPEDLMAGPAHLLTSPLPGYPGNSVILGRRITFGSPFWHLEDLRQGDLITVVTPQGAFAYTVSSSREVLPGSPDVFAQSPDARLTLVTSNSSYYPSGRIAVTAVLQGTPLEPVENPVVILEEDQLGLAGDTGALVAVIPSGIVFVLTVIGARALRRRMTSAKAAYLLASPLVLFVLWMLFRSADGLLPGTL
jgi:sortase A